MLSPNLLLTTALVLIPQIVFCRSVIVEKRGYPPALWRRSNTFLESTAIIPLQIGLAQNNLDTLHDELVKVSSPTSAHYGKHWNQEELTNHFKASTNTVDSVMEWLSDAGLDTAQAELSDSGTWLKLDVTVEEAENLLNSRYEVYEKYHEKGKYQRAACKSYSVPESVRDYIDIITPTLHFDVPHNIGQSTKLNKRISPRSAYPGSLTAANSGNGTKLSPLGFSQAYEAVANAGLLDNCVNITTIACLSALYNFGNYTQTQMAKNSYAGEL